MAVHFPWGQIKNNNVVIYLFFDKYLLINDNKCDMIAAKKKGRALVNRPKVLEVLAMWNHIKSARLSLWCTRVLMVCLVVLIPTAPFVLGWYIELTNKTASLYPVLLTLFYVWQT